MSINLPNINVASYSVGQSFPVSLQNMGVSAGGISSNPAFQQKLPTIYFFNDSGSGFNVTFRDSGQSFPLPAGAWFPMPVPLGESTIIFTVVYILPNPPVTTLFLAYFAPGEPVPNIMTLGNSPVGIGGSVQTSSVQTLSNEGNVANTLVIDIGDTALSQLWKIFTDHFILAVDQSGVAHFVLRGQTSGNPALIGQTGDTSEVQGSLLVDQNATITGTSTLTGVATLTATPKLTSKQVSDGSGNVLADWSGTGVTVNGNPATHGEFFYSGDGTHTDWKTSAISSSGVGASTNGTYNHNVTQFGSGATPTNVFANPYSGTPPGSQTVGFGSFTTTTVFITCGAAIAGTFHFWFH